MQIKIIASSSAGCCYLIESGGEQLLIECGISLKKIREALNFDLSKVVGCLVSHEHKDHCKAIRDITSKTTIPVYATNSLVARLCGYNCTTVEDFYPFDCGTRFLIMPIFLPHDVECFGYVVKCENNILFYVTDAGSVDYKIEGLTHLMIEANHSVKALSESTMNKTVVGRIAESHLSIDQALEFAESHKDTLQEVHLMHLSDGHSDEKVFERMAKERLGIPVYIAGKQGG